MRPLELTVEGFKSYRDEAAFVFDGRTLFGIVGPTGAGKSSILEAIIYGLYGKTPRLERDTKKLINASCDEAKVQLSFEADGSAWEVTRVVRRKGASQVVLRPLGDQSPEATGERNVNARAEELIGLDFGAFCSSVMLPQGEFDRFLSATSAERSRILKGIFRLERVDALREAAKSKGAALQGRVLSLTAEMENLAVAAGEIETIEARLKEEEALAADIRKHLDKARAAEAEVARAEESLAEIREAVEETSSQLSRLPDAPQLEALAETEEERRRTLQAAETEQKQSEKLLDKLEAQLSKAIAETGGEDVIAGARELLRHRARLQSEIDATKKEVAETDQDAKKAAATLQRTTKEASAAEVSLDSAREGLDALRDRHAALHLRKTLVKGEPCPVCEQPVSHPPATGRLPAMKSAEEKVEKAQANAMSAREALQAAKQSDALLTERRRSLGLRIEKCTAEVDRAGHELASMFGKVTDPVVEVERRAALLKETRSSCESARKELKVAAERTESSRKAAEAVASERRKHAAVLIEVCGWLKIPPPDLDSDATELLDAAKRAGDAGSAVVESGVRRAEKIEAAVSESLRLVAEFRGRFGLDDATPIVEALESVHSRIGTLRARIEEAKEAISRSARIVEEIGGLEAEKSLYDRLSSDLTDARFTAYLLDAERRLLSRLGSEKLFELTGRYRFDEEGEFQVVDVVTEKSRTPDTLSGGETFLASLALALALSEAVTLEGGRLGCFFLDEGFGALDPESLDLALEGIEKLAVPGRVIGLISHVGGIQARIDDLIVLEKASDGTTSVLQVEGPLSYPSVAI